MKAKIKIENVTVTDIEAEMFDVGVRVEITDEDGVKRDYFGFIDEDGKKLDLTLYSIELYDSFELTRSTEERIRQAIEKELQEAFAWVKEYISTRLHIIHKLEEVDKIHLKKFFVEKEIDVKVEYTDIV